MRTEQEIFRLILSLAERDENIRAVVLNGSRANPNIQKDLFQDFDIAFYVRDKQSMIRNRQWIDYFGERMILQLPDEMGSMPFLEKDCYSYLMQFLDGTRIDLRICSLEILDESIAGDSLTVVLLDKDVRIKVLPTASDRDYRPTKPTEKMYGDCCNEFWWLNPYVAKGLWRGELIYAKYFLDCQMRGELMKMVDWYFGIKTGFTRSMGKQGKFLQDVLDKSDWRLFESTYADAEFEHIWEALFGMGELFRRLAHPVAQHFGFRYPVEDDQKVTVFLHQVRALPADACSFDESGFQKENLD